MFSLRSLKDRLLRRKKLKNVQIVSHEKWVAYYHRLHESTNRKKFVPPVIIDDDVAKISLKKKHPEWIGLIILHESTEMKLRNKGYTYEKAHQKATEAEMRFSKKHHINWKEYSNMANRVYKKEKMHCRSEKIFLD